MSRLIPGKNLTEEQLNLFQINMNERDRIICMEKCVEKNFLLEVILLLNFITLLMNILLILADLLKLIIKLFYLIYYFFIFFIRVYLNNLNNKI